MIKIEAITLDDAYTQAASKLKCSVVELQTEVVQYPSKGIFGLFAKKAIIIAVKDKKELAQKKETNKPKESQKEKDEQTNKSKKPKKKVVKEKPKTSKKTKQEVFGETIMPESFVSMQDDEDYEDIDSEDYEDEIIHDNVDEKVSTLDINSIVKEVDKGLNTLFNFTCFSIEKVEVSAYDETTILVEFKGEDAALLIGKEGYRYKALSYMIFNWINTKYDVQLRLEIAEFLKNQEESVSRYLDGVRTGIQRDGRAQTKILDGVLVQIALKELRASYPDKYVAIRTTRDGLKYIIVNEYNK